MLFEAEVALRRQLTKVPTLTIAQFTLRLVRPTSSASRMAKHLGGDVGDGCWGRWHCDGKKKESEA
jgi:hypothetical protein